METPFWLEDELLLTFSADLSKKDKNASLSLSDMNKNIFEEIFQKYAELWLSQLARDNLRVLEFAKMIFAQLSNRCGKSLKAIYILLDILKLMFFFFINESFVK